MKIAKATSVIPSKKEIAQIKSAKRALQRKRKRLEISGRKQEFIQVQKNYREAFLHRKVKQARLKVMGERLAAYAKLKKENKDFVPDEVIWRDVKYTFGELYSEYELERFNYEQSIANEEYFKQGLKNFGLKDVEIQLVLDGKYVKVLPEESGRDKGKL